MRKTLAIGLALVLVAMIFAAMPMNVAAVGEVSYWAFDEGTGTTAYDSWGTNDGTIFGATWTTGIKGSALDFDGVDDFVLVPDDPSLDITDEITIKAWIKPITINGSYVIQKCPTTPGGVIWSLDIYPGTVRTILVEPDGTAHVAYGSTPIQPNVWQHIAVTWNGSMIRVFYNGQEDGTASFVGTMATSNGSLEIGLYSCGASYFHGVIDEVELYNKWLPNSEIEANYESGLNPLDNINIDPDTLNLKSNGKWITCYIELKAGHDVNDIDVSTVAITDINSVPVNIPAESHPTGVGDEDGDGIPDLMVKFDRSEVQDACTPGSATITISGSMTGGTTFSGSDTITVIDPP